MGDHEVSVAVTPQGQGADALVLGEINLYYFIYHLTCNRLGPDGETYFAEPHVQKMSMRAFLDYITDQVCLYFIPRHPSQSLEPW